jgi:hypothetical protein
MRIWSIHPQYLDAKGLVALWREALLAKKVLLGKTQGYRNHPQLLRFKNAEKPVDAIDQYLLVVYEEAVKRGYHFDKHKLGKPETKIILKVNSGQLDYEFQHLLNKLKNRDLKKYEEIRIIKKPLQHPIFQVVSGNIEGWEVL